MQAVSFNAASQKQKEPCGKHRKALSDSKLFACY
jgi:hypothetical protein